MNINTKTNEFLTELTKLVSNSGLPAVNARMALDLVRAQLITLERQAIAHEQQAAAKAETEAADNVRNQNQP